MKPYLLVTMYDDLSEVDSFVELIKKCGRFIYPVVKGISLEAENWSKELLIYVKGTNLVQYKADIIDVQRYAPTRNEIEFPHTLKGSSKNYRNYYLLSSLNKISPVHWNELKSSKDSKCAINRPPQGGATLRVFADF